MIFKDTPSTITRDQVRAELTTGKTGSASLTHIKLLMVPLDFGAARGDLNVNGNCSKMREP